MGRGIAVAVAVAAAGAATLGTVAGLGRDGPAAAARTSQTAERGSPPAARSAAAGAGRHGTVTIAATGDITLGREGYVPPGGATWLLRPARPYLHADMTLGNLETTLGSSTAGTCSGSSGGCYAFGAPASYAGQVRRTGFSILNLANNHANDAGPQGQVTTIRALRSAGLRYTGKPAQITRIRAGGLRVAVIGFAPYPWAQNLLDIPGAQRIVRRASRGADVVVVTMHAGAEGIGHEHVRRGMETFLGEQRGDPLRFAHAVVDAGADVVIGHGPHVLRGLESYRGKLIAYSLGNFSSYGTLSTDGNLGVSAILRVTLDEKGRLERGQLVPIRLMDAGRPTLDSSRSAWPLVRDLSRSDFGRRAAVISTNGAIRLPGGAA